MDNRSRIERFTNLASFFLVISLVVMIILIILGSFDLATQSQFTDIPGDPGAICGMFPARTINFYGNSSFSWTCPFSKINIVLSFLSIFLQVMPFILIKFKRFILGNILWLLIRGLSIVSIVKISIELFTDDGNLRSYCERNVCNFGKNSFDLTYFSLLLLYEVSMSFVWYFNCRKVIIEDLETRNRVGPNMNDAKIVIVSSSNVSASIEKICSICLDPVVTKDDNASLGCHHKFHFTCIQYWLRRKSTCPVCRAKPEELYIARRAMRTVELAAQNNITNNHAN